MVDCSICLQFLKLFELFQNCNNTHVSWKWFMDTIGYQVKNPIFVSLPRIVYYWSKDLKIQSLTIWQFSIKINLHLTPYFTLYIFASRLLTFKKVWNSVCLILSWSFACLSSNQNIYNKLSSLIWCMGANGGNFIPFNKGLKLVLQNCKYKMQILL